MVRRMVLLLCIASLVLLVAADALAARRRVALVKPDANLVRAVGVALSAWDIEVTSADATPPGSTLPDAERRAAAIADASHADAVAWISEGEAGAVLWMYDASTKQVASRVLGDRPPFDEPTAAAVALSLKTMLRSSTVAPEKERFGAGVVVEPPSVFRAETEGGGRLLPRGASELRAALGVSLWPRALGEWLGFAAGASIGPGARVDAPAFSGRFSDLTLASSLRSRMTTGRFAFEPSLGASLHFTTLEGTAVVDTQTLAVHRVDPSIDVGLALDARFGVVTVGARTTVGYMLSYQRYFVGDEPILSVTPLLLDLALRVTVGIF